MLNEAWINNLLNHASSLAFPHYKHVLYLTSDWMV